MTFLPAHVLDIAVRGMIAGDLPGLSVESLRDLADRHRERGELLSAEQYEELITNREEACGGLDESG